MFRSRKKSRRRGRSKLTRSRRLGVEVMEGRMMLSGTGIAPVGPTLDLTQYSFTPAQITLTGDWIQPIGQPTDGGYVTSYDMSNVQLAHPDALTPDLMLAFGWHGTSVAGVPRFNSGGAFDHADVYSNGNDFYLLSNSRFGSDGLVGQQFDVLPAWSSNDSPAINMHPVVIGPSPIKPGVSEGGAIPIQAIFADFRRDSHLASGVKVVSSPSAETSVASLASARRLSTTDAAIAGEWARATVFEIAGGEPTASDSQSTSDSSEKLQHDKPLSSIETSQQYVKLLKGHAAVRLNEVSPVGEPGQPQSAQPSAETAAAVTQLLKSELLAGSSAPLGASPFSAGSALGAESPNITALASAAVFDQLGKGSTAVIESAVDGKSPLRSIGTSPLLMVLALERITALNSRRATRESRIAAAKKPRRLGS